MKNVVGRLLGIVWATARLIGLSAIGTLALAGYVALRHMLETPQALESSLPGEAHLYRCAYGHMYYKLLGAADAPPLVLLHTPALRGSAYEMRGLVEPLARHFRVYAPDLLGFGLSDRPSIDYSAEVYTHIISDFLAQVVKEPALIVASRLSCNYAVEVAATAPHLCNGLVLLSPLGLHGMRRPLAGYLPPELLESGPVKTLLYPLLAQGQRTLARLRSAVSSPMGAPVSASSDDAYMYATTHRFGAEHAVMALVAGKLTSDVSREIERVQQPTLMIWGADALGAVQREQSALGASATSWGPVRTHIELLPEGGLAVHEEAPRKVAETLLQWSQEHMLPSPAISKHGDESKMDEAQPEAAPVELSPTTVEAYCIKCKAKRVMHNPREVTIKNGRIAVQGTCSVCGAQLIRMGRLAPGFPQTPV